MPTISNLNNARIKLRSVKPYFERVDHFLNNDSSSSVEFGNKTIDNIESIRLEDLSFSFSNNSLFSLKGINLKFNLKSLTAIVGPSGGGKTTLVDIILGLYSQYNGSLFINGDELKEIDIKSYRSQIAYIDQQNFLLHLSSPFGPAAEPRHGPLRKSVFFQDFFHHEDDQNREQESWESR